MNIETAFAALSDETRLSIVTRLAEKGETDATELANPFGISQPAISRHLRILEDAGWVLRRRIGTRRPVRLNPVRLDEVAVWSGKLKAALAANYARLDQVLEEGEDG
ncbi:MAG: metalloregulator ArsR/SmtB family transcription factor [Paracoccaceae bacterium]|nr:metalloregulator ArsR/SmtB family transcription factor [Paracoccaceae bacterium]